MRRVGWLGVVVVAGMLAAGHCAFAEPARSPQRRATTAFAALSLAERPDDTPVPPAVAASPALRHAVTINPLGPVLALAGTVLLRSAGIGYGAFIFNLRYHHRVNDTLAWTAAPTFGYLSLLFENYTAGVKGGPRMSLTGRGLQGAYLLGQFQLGWLWSTTTRGRPMSSAFACGAGVEAGWSWAWSSGLLVELGLGLMYTASLPTDGQAPIVGPRPNLNASLGYGW